MQNDQVMGMALEIGIESHDQGMKDGAELVFLGLEKLREIGIVMMKVEHFQEFKASILAAIENASRPGA